MMDIAMMCLAIFCGVGIIGSGVFAYVADSIERKKEKDAEKARAYRW